MVNPKIQAGSCLPEDNSHRIHLFKVTCLSGLGHFERFSGRDLESGLGGFPKHNRGQFLGLRGGRKGERKGEFWWQKETSC